MTTGFLYIKTPFGGVVSDTFGTAEPVVSRAAAPAIFAVAAPVIFEASRTYYQWPRFQ
jgi:hypothetical protein